MLIVCTIVCKITFYGCKKDFIKKQAENSTSQDSFGSSQFKFISSWDAPSAEEINYRGTDFSSFDRSLIPSSNQQAAESASSKDIHENEKGHIAIRIYDSSNNDNEFEDNLLHWDTGIGYDYGDQENFIIPTELAEKYMAYLLCYSRHETTGKILKKNQLWKTQYYDRIEPAPIEIRENGFFGAIFTVKRSMLSKFGECLVEIVSKTNPEITLYRQVAGKKINSGAKGEDGTLIEQNLSTKKTFEVVAPTKTQAEESEALTFEDARNLSSEMDFILSEPDGDSGFEDINLDEIDALMSLFDDIDEVEEDCNESDNPIKCQGYGYQYVYQMGEIEYFDQYFPRGLEKVKVSDIRHIV